MKLKGKVFLFMAVSELVALLSGGCKLQKNESTYTPPESSKNTIETAGEMPSQKAMVNPTPTKTVEEMTDNQKMYFSWLNSKHRGDVYACAVAYQAYQNGELDSLIESKKIKEKDIKDLERLYSRYNDFYGINIDNILYETDCNKLSDIEIYIKMIKDLPIENYDDIDIVLLYKSLQNNIIKNGDSIISTFPEESREKIEKMQKLYKNITNEEVLKEFEEKIKSGYLDAQAQWYFVENIFMFDANASEYNEPQVIYNGEKMGFIKYNIRTKLYENSKANIEEYLKEKYIGNELVLGK